MTTRDDVFTEVSAVPAVRSVALSHLSVEFGHLYMEDYEHGPEHLRRYFRRIAPWAQAAASTVPVKRPRISTCFLIDDYFTRFSSPREVVPAVVTAARESGLEIDYVARESGCARVGEIDLAAVVQAHIVDEPPRDTNGGRPPASVSGWLTNGERSPSAAASAMAAPRQWSPPRESAARNHSIFIDVELWSEEPAGRKWSCPFLAAVWQLQRLGLLRHRGEPVAEPVPAEPASLPREWDEMPAIVKVNPAAAALRAYRTFSVLDSRFLAIEHAVRTILAQVAVDPLVSAQVLERAGNEGLELPEETVDRISYLFD
ncbi:SCO2522 family protein [Paractinoplanes globisporus]|uniref:SCO2522 family protein n=1 Tax=Paractinoplanes globisporus TaxID=113565 RepID=A0ABW6WB32_9ACTN|nr:SCO2522 family protein [Actinoplanes globisporus]